MIALIAKGSYRNSKLSHDINVHNHFRKKAERTTLPVHVNVKKEAHRIEELNLGSHRYKTTIFEL